jgi:hypothetical protein
VVHSHSTAGHDYAHFSRESLHELFAQASAPARVVDMYDPLVVRAATEHDARRRMCDYVGAMYGISRLFDEQEDVNASWALLEQSFDHSEYLARLRRHLDVVQAPLVYRSDGEFVAEVPRVALVAVARKAV